MLRIYLTSQVRVEHGETLLAERDLPGRQGRVALALLVAERDRPVTSDEVAEAFWLEDPPPAWEKAVESFASLVCGPRRLAIGATREKPGRCGRLIASTG